MPGTAPHTSAFRCRKIRKLMYTKDVLLNMDLQPGGVQRHRHPCFFGTMEEVMQDCCGQCPELEGAEPDDAKDFVSGELRFMTVNPGQQVCSGELRWDGSVSPTSSDST